MRILNKEQEESMYRLIEKGLELNNKNNKLQQRIDKTIEYLEKKTKNNQTYIYTEDIEKAIKMLKGEYKE